MRGRGPPRHRFEWRGRTRFNLAYRWFCRLDLSDRVPDHSTFSKNRHGRFRQSGLFRRLFEAVLARCISEGIVGGEAFGVDASLIRADANREDGIVPAEWSPDPHASRATSDYLETLDDAAFGAATEVEPKYVPPVDPAARWSAADRGKAHFLYATNDLVDLENAIIVDVEPTAPIRQAETKAARDMPDRTQDRFGLYPERLVGDTGYGGAEMLGWLVHARGIEPHIPVFDTSGRRDGTLQPRGLCLRSPPRRLPAAPPGHGCARTGGRSRVTHDTICDDWDATLPCQQGRMRRVPLEVPLRAEGAGEKAPSDRSMKARATWPAISPGPTPTSPRRRQRKKVEMLFAHLKRILKLDRLRLRGPNGARDEFHLAATARNLRKLAKLVPLPA